MADAIQNPEIRHTKTAIKTVFLLFCMAESHFLCGICHTEGCRTQRSAEMYGGNRILYGICHTDSGSSAIQIPETRHTSCVKNIRKVLT